MNNNSIIKQALSILEAEVREDSGLDNFATPDKVMNYLVLKLARKTTEEFGVILLTNTHQVIKFVKLESGIENRAHIYMKKAIRTILKSPTCAVILYHNHPSGTKEFSSADLQLTNKFKTVLDLLEIRLLDHILVAKNISLSMREECPNLF